MAERTKDSIDWRSDKAKKIVEVIDKLGFRIAIVSDRVYELEGYEVLRLVNIIKTSKRMKRSLNGLENLIRRRGEIYRDQIEILKGRKKLK